VTGLRPEMAPNVIGWVAVCCTELTSRVGVSAPGLAGYTPLSTTGP
jgi:hypothetical protein